MLCVAGCTDKDIKTEPTEYVPTTTIDPSTIEFGYDQKTDTYDRWYLVGSDDVTYIYFSYENSQNYDKYICTYNLVKSGVVTINTPLVLDENNHLVSPSSLSIVFDIVFEDYFNAYDYASGERYSRGSADEYNSYFADKTYTMENEQYAITFNSDFTCTKSDKKGDTQGTWNITSPHCVVCTYSDSQVVYSINYFDDYSVNSIVSNDDVLYPEISEDETVNKYKAY